MSETVHARLLGRAELPVLPISEDEIERAGKHGLSRTGNADLSKPVITYVEQFATDGDRIAVRDEERTLSYRELSELARRIATLLIDSGVGPGTVVGVGGRRGAGVVAAFLATELIGALYVPADATWPAARVRDVLAQADARILLSVDKEPAPALAAGAAEAGIPVVPLELGDHAPWPGEPLLESLDRPRYVLFTSGSTGRPKGAVVEHIGMLNHLWAKIVDLGMTASDVLAQTAPLGFDISIWQMLCPLLLGGQVHVIGDEVAYDPMAFAEAVRRQGLTVVELVPTMVRLLLDDLTAPETLRGLRWMIATGEELPGEVARRWLDTLPHARLLNAYGPTECSDDVTHHDVVHADLDLLRLPIGTPIINTQLYVLKREDAGWSACEPGEAGELFVGGICVGRGYLGDPDRTRDAFYQDPFRDGGKLYRTGDAVRLLPQGALQYLGRVDRQVKISGVRMELGEIEAVLQRHPSVGAVAVVVHEM